MVSREDPNSRQNTVKEISRRAAAGGKWPQIVIFPEGTCTNQSSLISFKPGTNVAIYNKQMFDKKSIKSENAFC